MRSLIVGIALLVALAGPSFANDTMDKIKARCAGKWKTDYEMQKYCIDQQVKAANNVSKLQDGLAENSEEMKIILRCYGKWTKSDNPDWGMIEYCTKNQLKAYRSLQ